MQHSPDHPIFRTNAEVQAFFLRAEPFVDSETIQVDILAGPMLKRLGQFEQIVENAGDLGAVLEIIAEIKREGFGNGQDLPHLAIFPSGWVAMLRHPDCGASQGRAQIRIMICPGTAADGDDVTASLAQVLVGLQDMTGRTRSTPPLTSRRDMPWPEALTSMVGRDGVEAAYRQLLDDRGGTQPARVRSELIDHYLRWIATHRPISGPIGRDTRGQAAARGQGAAPVDLKDHVINMRFGELSRDGQFQTSGSDVAALADRAQAWISAQSGRRLVIYAHGGLVSEGKALKQARQTAEWWIQNDVYPVYCIWESDALSIIFHLIQQSLGGKGRGLFDLSELRDSAVERLTHALGPRVWSAMKHSAQLGSTAGDQHGMTLLISQLRRAFGKTPPPIDLVGHSAGSILLLHMLQRMQAAGLSAQTFQTLAPAATTALYRAGLQAAPMLRHRIYTMTDPAERADHVANIYGKSLLYLVSRGFELQFGETISGLQKDLLADPQLVAGLTNWSSGVTREALVFSPTPEGTPQRLQSHATSHGDFDNDPATMWSVMRFIRGSGQDQQITPFPDLAAASRGSDDMMTDLPVEVSDYLAATNTPAAAQTAPALPAAARNAARLALTIGIDSYGGSNRLEGCVRDSDCWRDMLSQRGYQVTQFTRPEQTGREQLMTHLRDFVAGAGAGDSLIWHFSGHGMQIMPADSPEDDHEQTGCDQAIVAANTGQGLETQLAHALIDDQIHTILQGLHPAAQLHAFLDSCYAGTATRLVLPGRPRSLGTLRQARYLPHHRSLAAPDTARSNAYAGVNHVLYSAASATQTALENGSPAQGVFSRAVSDLLQSQPGAMTNAQFRTRIRSMTAGYEQTPGVHCDPARLTQPFPLV